MAAAEVSIDEFHVDSKVNKEQPIRPDQMWIDFTVTLTTDTGCCALVVSVCQAKLFWSDIPIGYTDKDSTQPLVCRCFRRNEPRKFRIYAGGSVPALPQPPVAGRDLLTPQLSGVWPKSDGPADNTLELYVKIEVIRCNQFCEDHGDADCKTIPGDRAGYSTIGEVTTRNHQRDVDIVDGTGWDEFWTWVLALLGFVGTLVRPFLPPPVGTKVRGTKRG